MIVSYNYSEMREQIFTARGVEVLTAVQTNVHRALKAAGAVMADKAITGVSGDSWLMLAALDYMVEKGELREVTGSDVWGQHRVFVKGGRP